MFRLSNDLRQYFTKKQYNYKNNDLTLIEAIIGYQLESDDCIDTFEEYADSLGEIFIDYEQDLELLNLHVFNDLFNSNIYQYIFQSFIKSDDFVLTEVDGVLGYMYDEENEEFINISNNMPLQVRKHINRFYKEAQNECYYVDGEERKLDSYCAETIGFRLYHLKIYNKSLARRLRKNYKANGSFYALCNQLGFYMENGQFLLMEYSYLEASGFYDQYIDSSIIANAIEDLNKELQTNRVFNPGISAAIDEISDYERDDLITAIIKILETENEVII